MEGTLKLILDNLTEDYAAAVRKIRERGPILIGEIRRYVKNIGFWLLASFLLTIPMLAAGIYLESKTLIIFAGIIRAVLTGIFLTLMSPIGIILETLKEGASGSIQRYINFVRGLLLSELFITAIIAWLPLKNNPDLIAMFILLSILASFLGSKLMSRNVSLFIVGGLLIITVTSFIFPYSTQYIGMNIKRGDETMGMPIRVDEQIRCNDLLRGKYNFFGNKGVPLNYYFRDSKTGEIELYQLQSKNMTRPSSGDQLYPIDSFIVDEFKKQVCVREENASLQAKEDAERRKLEEENRKKEAELRATPQLKPNVTPQTQTNNIPAISNPKPESMAPAPNFIPDYKKPQDPPTVATKSTAPPVISPVPSQLMATRENLPLPPPEPKKPYAYSIKPVRGSGEVEIQVSREIAADIGEKMLDACQLSERDAIQKAEKIIVVEKVKFDRSDNSGEITCAASIYLRIVDAKSGNTINRINTTQEQRAFDWETARRLALDTAIKSANIRLKKVL
jgi:hypothetical protein